MEHLSFDFCVRPQIVSLFGCPISDSYSDSDSHSDTTGTDALASQRTSRVAISVVSGRHKYVTFAASAEHLPKFATDVPLAIAKFIWHYYSLLQNVLFVLRFISANDDAPPPTTAMMTMWMLDMNTERRS